MAEKFKHDVIKYDIIDHCNLNCRNCGHFSQFRIESGEKSVDHIAADIKLLVEHMEVKGFHIFGGEPLMHSNINGVISILRSLLGDKIEIRLLTNGLKLLSMPESFFIICKIKNIVIELTEYILKVDYPKIEEAVRSRDIPLIVRVTHEFYNFMDPTGKQDAEESFRQCSVCNHTYYENGNIFLCAYVKSVPFANKHFGHKIEYNSVPINASVEVMKDYLSHPCLTCRFCKASRQPETWRIEKSK